MISSKKCTTDICAKFKRAFLTSSSECEPILNEDSRPVTHLEDVVTFDSDDSISLEELVVWRHCLPPALQNLI